ncbi:nucleoside-diphosphate-sugar epimerase [Motilibacter rhizosphaerae]|uniref:Nucleoside-diphosphate-sugar epimerase n=1 Tax=Motilibacter rhizosphaerae TaxID=598652 RepID=A0A4Q7NT29_9ACTN|nr:NAD-dependent epimerase/dehydratase family protein [Motilibacter rhizosphaerae]RZS90215.1 nucleoside-diphosphate-sugar epimerase [Motilibacter rhizosphaerae]
MSTSVILGKGPVGSAVARLLVERGDHVRVVSRSGGRSEGGVEHVQADAGSPGVLAAASAGAVAVYNCANPAYHRWPVDWPPLAAALLEAAERTGAVLVTTGNLYPYGPVDVPMTEALPDAATDTKGRIRAGMTAEAMALHRAGRIRAVEVRPSDFYGPGVAANGHLAERVVPPLLAGKAASVIGDPDVRHSFTYVPDVARALVTAADEERAWGRVWHVPTAAPVSRREAVTGLAAAAGVPAPAVRSMPWGVVRALGVVAPRLREVGRLSYQWERPYVLDGSAFEREFGLAPTPMDEGFVATVDWWRGRASVSA